MTQQKLSAERARELFSYDPETGSLVRKVNKARTKAGDKAGSIGSEGYLTAKRELHAGCTI